ncbi:hypothetical protein [Thalassotalea fusca]
MTNTISISIFAYREGLQVLSKSIASCITAAQNYSGKVIINVLVNGNELLFNELVEFYQENCLTNDQIEVNAYFFSYGDKANTWNQYFHLIKAEADLHVFIDGYVYVQEDAFKKLDVEYQSSPFIAASGVPTVGRSAKALREAMISHGGIHGNFCILSDTAVEQIRQRSFRIPLRLYRVDGLVGAIINFNFSPKDQKWDSTLIRVIPDISWGLEEKSMLNLESVLSQLKRWKRQYQGDFENKALRELLAVKRIAIGELPKSAFDLLKGYLLANPLTKMQRLMSPIKANVYDELISACDSFNLPSSDEIEKYRMVKL